MIWALVSALLVLVASPPVDAWPLCVVALVPLFISFRDASVLQAAARGWLFGVIVNCVGQVWGSDVLMSFAHFSRASSVAALVGMSALQGFVFALFGAGVVLLRSARVSPYLAYPFMLSLAEALVPFIFPWNIGIMAWRVWPLLQVAEVGGPAAVSTVLALINLLATELLVARTKRTALPSGFRAALATLVLVIGLGLARAGQVAWAAQHSEQLSVAAVQPNFGLVSVDERKRNGDDFIARLRRATDAAQAAGAGLIVWPESAFPYLFDRQLEAEFAPGHPWSVRSERKSRVLFGSLSHRFGDAVVFNSAVLFTAEGKVGGLADKQRLMPFGEYIPFRSRFPDWAAALRADMPDWPEIEAGGPKHLLVDGSLRLGVLICYEDVFSMDSLAEANLLVTVANHAWFGPWAPHQALALATVRAVELRRPLVRATNTGVSSVSDALGRVLAESDVRASASEMETITATVGLADTRSLGPITARFYPAISALVLALATLFARRHHRK